MKAHKGQISSIDAMIGVAALTLICLTSMLIFSSAYHNVSLMLENDEFKTTSFFAMEQLLSPGVPANWQTLQSSEVDNFGMEKEPAVLDSTKMNALADANYSEVKGRIGLAKSDFYLEVSDYYDGDLLYFLGEKKNTDSAIALTRISTLNGSLVRVRMLVEK